MSLVGIGCRSSRRMDEMLPRLATFALLPLTVTIALSTVRLARLGFYYSSPTIACSRCGQKFSIDDSLTGSIESHAQRCSLSAAEAPSAVTAAQQQPAGHDGQQNYDLWFPATSTEVPSGSSCPPSQLTAGNTHTHDGNTTNMSLEYTGMPNVTHNSTNLSHPPSHHPDFERLKDEDVRLSTFHDWPERVATIVDARDLAKAGLFYTGQTDRVQCAFCHGYLRNWVQGDIPADEHRRHFPECSFIRKLNDDDTTAAATSSPGISCRQQQRQVGACTCSTLSADKSSCHGLQHSFQVNITVVSSLPCHGRNYSSI